MRKIFAVLFELAGGRSCLLIGVLTIVAVAGVLLASMLFEAEQENLIDDNDGFGNATNPIPVGEWAHFEDFDVRVTRYVYPADDLIATFDPEPFELPPGFRYALLWIELRCQEGPCRSGEIEPTLVVGDERIQPNPDVYVDVRFGGREVLTDAHIEGWVAYTVPILSQPPTLEMVQRPWLLYVELPVAETDRN